MTADLEKKKIDLLAMFKDRIKYLAVDENEGVYTLSHLLKVCTAIQDTMNKQISRGENLGKQRELMRIIFMKITKYSRKKDKESEKELEEAIDAFKAECRNTIKMAA